jgi:hypothetical protein
MVQSVFTFFPLDNLNNAKKSLAAVTLCTFKNSQLFCWPGLKGRIPNDLNSSIRIQTKYFRIHSTRLFFLTSRLHQFDTLTKVANKFGP